MSKLKPPVREYNFTDSYLPQLADGILALLIRDGIPFTKRRWSEAKSTNLITLRDSFVATKPDDYYKGILGIKTEEKDAARAVLSTPIRTIFVAAENVFGVKSSHYASFGVSAISKLNDDKMIRNSRLVVATARDFQEELEDEGITIEMLDATDILIENFDKTVDAQLAAQRDRDSATADRIKKGNLLYRALVKVCNTGKDIWYETDESKYNDYVIYNTPSGKPEPTGMGRIRGTITNSAAEPLEGVLCIVKGTELVAETDEYGEYELENVPVGKRSIEFTLATYKKYIDELVEVFENQETKNDIEMESDETSPPPET
jgi:hypothetical protein